MDQKTPAIVLALAASFTVASIAHAQALTVEPRKIVPFDAPLSRRAKALAALAKNPPVTAAKCAVAVPTGFSPAQPRPIFIVNAAQTASAVAALTEYAEPITDAGWIALAADAATPARVESSEWCYAMILAAYDRLDSAWPGVKRWAVATGGFSGGAKRSAYIGALLMEDRHSLIGLWLGGCNEDRPTDALKWHKPGPAYLRLPIVLANGTNDPVATPAHVEQVRASLAKSNFTNIRLTPYEGAHAFDASSLREALPWFVESARGK
jgi:dienelactone hydrolase